MKLFLERSQLLFFKIIFLIFISFEVAAQNEIKAKELSKKEIRALRKEKAFERQKIRYQKRGLNPWGINENAPNLVMAIREHLGSARIDTQRGLVIIRQSESMKNSQSYPLWIVDGQQFNFPPNNIALQNIREVKVYESLAETNKWGQLGRAGVVEIITLNAIK
tara:strand:+ start:252 stop:743 length:492 start_codon:yes stop_codon:yes gene_type:complete